ncbi:alpha-1,2-fucosyltransferase [Haloferula rosea]|uniref:Alpha-1,2-fucosyltransferase n=1 Tax=Haloferula rosea TaxID=490093 RepID=A0A934R8E5_9BACT|nr:alpha-1,2-fucosyltransferase [Haloferula rosea]MBK1825805.1 alpha-1,2-fucosyltransferase [Haloferula rosea]
MNPCVVAIIKGGLGNQLFSYAAARAFAERSGRELFIDDDSGFLRDGYGRSFRLNHFPISAKPAPAKLRLGDPKAIHHKWTRTWNKCLPGKRRSYLRECPDKGAEQLLDFDSTAPAVHLNGYWQSEEYFKDHARIIRDELTPPVCDPVLEAELALSPSVFVHVRRVRYSPALPVDYYQSSISMMADKLGRPRFEVFGDDIGWARRALDFGEHDVRFHDSEDSDELRDYRLMSSCRHAIVANSSFSWWAAWIRPDQEKIVCTPADPGWPVKPAAGWMAVPHEDLIR